MRIKEGCDSGSEVGTTVHSGREGEGPVPLKKPNESIEHRFFCVAETKTVMHNFIRSRMPHNNEWFEFGMFGLQLPEHKLTQIDTRFKDDSFAKKYYKILAWMHSKLLITC